MADANDLAALSIKVAELERKIDFILTRLNLPYTDNALSLAESEAAKWLRLGDKNKIQAIKAYREATGVGLAEAMKAVDALEIKLALKR